MPTVPALAPAGRIPRCSMTPTTSSTVDALPKAAVASFKISVRRDCSSAAVRACCSWANSCDVSIARAADVAICSARRRSSCVYRWWVSDPIMVIAPITRPRALSGTTMAQRNANPRIVSSSSSSSMRASSISSLIVSVSSEMPVRITFGLPDGASGSEGKRRWSSWANATFRGSGCITRTFRTCPSSTRSTANQSAREGTRTSPRRFRAAPSSSDSDSACAAFPIRRSRSRSRSSTPMGSP